MSHRRLLRVAGRAVLGATFGLFGACQSFVAPPEPSIEGLSNGALADPAAPLVVKFSKAIDPKTLSLQIIKFDPDAQGQLPYEGLDAGAGNAPFFTHAYGRPDTGGTGTLDPTRTVFTITLDARLPVGPELALLVSPGLSDTAHDGTATTEVTRRVPFSYVFTCSGAGTKLLASGVYFFLLNVEQPVGTQIKVFADVDLDPGTGKFVGQFTLASRVTDPTRCSPACTMGDVCQTLPPPSTCVVPSTRAGDPSEWPDFYANDTPPVGFSFTVDGCAVDEGDGTTTFATQPANMVVQQPAVSVDGLTVLASFSKGATGSVTATGSCAGDDIVFGTAPLGKGSGTVQAALVPAAMAPKVPGPPPGGDF